jgi:hypothetical protein
MLLLRPLTADREISALTCGRGTDANRERAGRAGQLAEIAPCLARPLSTRLRFAFLSIAK